MSTVEFWTQVSPDRTLAVPPEAAAKLSPHQRVRVIVLIPDADSDAEWSRLTADQFVAGYAATDAIYDELPAR
jgi:hypothetical protein